MKKRNWIKSGRLLLPAMLLFAAAVCLTAVPAVGADETEAGNSLPEAVEVMTVQTTKLTVQTERIPAADHSAAGRIPSEEPVYAEPEKTGEDGSEKKPAEDPSAEEGSGTADETPEVITQEETVPDPEEKRIRKTAAGPEELLEHEALGEKNEEGRFFVYIQKTAADPADVSAGETAVYEDGAYYVYAEDMNVYQYRVTVRENDGNALECPEYDRETGTVSFDGLALGGIAFSEISGETKETIIDLSIAEESIREQKDLNRTFFGNGEDQISLRGFAVNENVQGLSLSCEMQEGPAALEKTQDLWTITSDRILTEDGCAVILAKACNKEKVLAQAKIRIPVKAPFADELEIKSGAIAAGADHFVSAADPKITLSWTGGGISAGMVESEGVAEMTSDGIAVRFNGLKDGAHFISVCKKTVAFIVDTKAPEVTITQNNTSAKGTDGSTDYYDGPVEFIVEIRDLNLDPDRTYFRYVCSGKEKTLALEPKDNAGEDGFVRTGTIRLDDADKDPAIAGDVLAGITGSAADKAGNTVRKVKGNGEKALDLTVKDGRIERSENARKITVDQSLPKIDLFLPDQKKSANGLGKLSYYAKKQTITVRITDRNLKPEKSVISYTLSKDGKVREYSVPCSSSAVACLENAAYELVLTVADGQKIGGLKVTAEDHCGHRTTDHSAESNEYIVDTTPPAVSLNVSGNIDSFFTNGPDIYVKLSTPASAAGGSAAREKAETITLTVSVTDRNICRKKAAGYKNAYYVTNDLKNGIRWSGNGKENRSSVLTYRQSVTVRPDSTGEIRFRITVTDLAGNRAAELSADPQAAQKEKIRINKKGTIAGKFLIDRERPESGKEERNTPVIVMTPNVPEAGKTAEDILLYAGSMSYSLTVYDPVHYDSEGKKQYSGLASVSWTAASQGQPDLIRTSGNVNAFSGEQSASLIVPVLMNGTGEANDVIVRITASDRAGNTTLYEQKLAMDDQEPHVTVSYDNQNVRNERFFREKRTATIRVDELNFDAERVKVETQGVFSGWSRNGNEYTAAVDFEEDGEYTLKVSAQDRAGNTAPVDLFDGGKNAAPDSFTIDQTKPVIRLSFDHDHSVHGNGYYNKPRTGVLTVEEHSFRPADVAADLKAESGGRIVFEPEPEGWAENEDSHFTLIAFSADARYYGTVKYTDPAGNEAETLVIEPFTVDTTPPDVQILDVKSKGAYAGAVMPRIRFSDACFDRSACTIRWSAAGPEGIKTLSAENAGAGKDIENGWEFLFEDPAAVPENDGIYRLSARAEDLAGNTSGTEEILYSVNRFGSVYDTDGDSDHFSETRKLLKTSFTDKAPRVSVRETNPDKLKNQKVSVAVNGSVRQLEEGREFEILEEQDSGEHWHRYVYNIFDSAFQDAYGAPVQGSYTITIYSEDAAGNLNSNRMNAEQNQLDLSFVLDTDPPTGYVSVSGLTEESDTIRAGSTTVSFYWEDNNGVGQVDFYVNEEKVGSLSGAGLAAAGGTKDWVVSENKSLQSAYAVITDAAGNQAITGKKEFYLNSSGWRIFLRNRAALVLTAAAVPVSVFLAVWIAVKLKRRAKKQRKMQEDRKKEGDMQTPG